MTPSECTCAAAVSRMVEFTFPDMHARSVMAIARPSISVGGTKSPRWRPPRARDERAAIAAKTQERSRCDRTTNVDAVNIRARSKLCSPVHAVCAAQPASELTDLDLLTPHEV
jgi:hypothetical protein